MRLSRLVIALLLAAVIGYFVFRPVCIPLSAENSAASGSPLEHRTDRDFYLRVFQQRDGQWHQCKTWLSRQFFF